MERKTEMSEGLLKDSVISCFADEIAVSLDRQIEVLKELEITQIELRSTDGVGVADYDERRAKDVKRKLDNAGIKVSAIGSPIGKIKITDDFAEHKKQLLHMERLADLFETPYIRIFSFYLPGRETAAQYEDEVFYRMQQMVGEVEKNGKILLHENEKEIYGESAENCRKLMERFYGEHFQCTFDFANFVQCGEDTREAYRLLKHYIAYIHIKDARSADHSVVLPGAGDGHLKEILADLDRSGYKGCLSLEPHLANFAGLQNLEHNAKMREENNTEKAFREAYDAFCRLTGRKK